MTKTGSETPLLDWGPSAAAPIQANPDQMVHIPGEGSSAPGQSGPNAKPKGAADGKQAKIPAPAMQAKE